MFARILYSRATTGRRYPGQRRDRTEPIDTRQPLTRRKARVPRCIQHLYLLVHYVRCDYPDAALTALRLFVSHSLTPLFPSSFTIAVFPPHSLSLSLSLSLPLSPFAHLHSSRPPPRLTPFCSKHASRLRRQDTKITMTIVKPAASRGIRDHTRERQ